MYCTEALGIIFIAINCEYESSFMPACFGWEGNLIQDLIWDQVSELRWLIEKKTGLKANKYFFLVLQTFNRYFMFLLFVPFSVITPKNMFSPQLILLRMLSPLILRRWPCPSLQLLPLPIVYLQRWIYVAEVEMPETQVSDEVIVSYPESILGTFSTLKDAM